jgi:hypothetical protein
MTNQKDTHLDEEQLIQAVVDEADLPAFLQEHLKACRLCHAERDHLEQDLVQLGHLAERFTPSPRKGVKLPVRESTQGLLQWYWNWRRTFMAGMVVAAAAVIVVYGAISARNAEEAKLAALTQEIWEDELLMAEISALSENALPLFCSEISGESYQDFDEDFMDFVVPSSGDDLVSCKEGGVLC